jgi:hypothetical protein
MTMLYGTCASIDFGRCIEDVSHAADAALESSSLLVDGLTVDSIEAGVKHGCQLCTLFATATGHATPGTKFTIKLLYEECDDMSAPLDRSCYACVFSSSSCSKVFSIASKSTENLYLLPRGRSGLQKNGYANCEIALHHTRSVKQQEYSICRRV